ncbi:MAG: hypothetical protein WCD20_04040 [Rhodomicrobium sp.]
MSAPPMILLALALSFVAFAGSPTPAHAQSAFQPTRGPRIILGRRHPGRITGLSDSGIVVDLKDGGTQTVQFNEIWRIRRAFAYDEPPGTTVIDFADNRLFVATPIATVVDDAAKKIPLVQFTAPNRETVYMAAEKVTDISNSIPGLHNPLSKSVIGTRDGAQQVVEAADSARRMVTDAHTAP